MIISKDYLKSVCCTDEWGAFYGKALHDKSCVIYPIIIDDSAPPALISHSHEQNSKRVVIAMVPGHG